MTGALAVDAGPVTAAGAAMDAARRAGAGWAAEPLAARATVLQRAARELAAADWLVGAIAVDSARPIHEVWSAELLPTVDALRWLSSAGQAALRPRRLSTSRLQWYLGPAHHELCWDPLGVVGVVSPANSLLFLPVSQIAGALLGGNAALWKPAPGGTAVALAVLGILTRAGLPPQVLQIVPGGAEAARAVVEAGIDKLLFTGGAPAGLDLYRRQARCGRPAVLELAGRHVALVLRDAPIARTARGLAWSKLANGGRNCVSPQLVLVEPPSAPLLVEALGRALASVAFTRSVPPSEGRRCRELVEDAVCRGARVAWTAPDGGPPTLLTDVAPGMRVVDEEVRGPILAVAPAEADDAVAQVNASEARLSASVWSADVSRARRLAARLDVGQVWINDALHPAAQPAVPLAGRGRGGFGATRGLAGLLETVQPKVVSIMPRWAPCPHWEAPRPATTRLLAATARLAAAQGLRARLAAALALLRAGGALLTGRR